MADAFDLFAASWLDRLNDGARTVFHHSPLSAAAGLHSAAADAYVAALGYRGIGFNWELLDAAAAGDAPRSAAWQLMAALTGQISNPSRPWLNEAEAQRCADDLLACFDAASLTVVSNRYDGLWNPISDAPTEWGFVCFDAQNIALLLIAEA